MFDIMKTMMMIMMMMTKPKKKKKTQKKGFASVINCSQINNTIQNLSRFFCTYIRVIQSCVRSQDKRPEFCIYCSPLFFLLLHRFIHTHILIFLSIFIFRKIRKHIKNKCKMQTYTYVYEPK